LICISAQLLHCGGALAVDLTSGLFATGVRFRGCDSESLAIEAVRFLLRLLDQLLGQLTGFLELLLEFGLQAFRLGQLLLGLGTTGGDVTLPTSTPPCL